MSTGNVEPLYPLYPLDLIALSDVEPEALRWLWRGRIARGKVTLVIGDPGDGKSFLTLAVAAAISRGRALPDGEPVPTGHTLMWNGEDGIADTIRVRAGLVGADLTKLHVIQGATSTTGARIAFGLQHLADLHAELERRRNVDLVVIDPLAALLAGVDTHKDAEVRSSLQPLSDLAKASGAAVVVVAHLNKATAQRALYRAGGSIGFVGLARSVLLVARDHESGRRAVAQVKSNLAEQVHPVEFRIDDEGFGWMGVADDLNSDRLLAAPLDGGERTAFMDAKRAILETVESAASVSARDLDRSVRNAGISQRTYERARAALAREDKIERVRTAFQGEVRWRTTVTANHRQAPPNVENVAEYADSGGV